MNFVTFSIADWLCVPGQAVVTLVLIYFHASSLPITVFLHYNIRYHSDLLV